MKRIDQQFPTLSRDGSPSWPRTAGVLTLCLACLACAQDSVTPPTQDSAPASAVQCIPDGTGFLSARIGGVIDAEIDWKNEGTTCTGEVRPDGGVRVSFRNQISDGAVWLIVFGIPELQEGESASALATNLTLVREGTGEFYGTQGTDKCTIDSVRQEPMQGAPHKTRTYRVIARGFCTEPARALQGEGSVLMSRFDFAGILQFADEPAEENVQPPSTTTARNER